MTRDELERRIEGFASDQAWNHNFQLPYGIQTRPGNHESHGKNEVKARRLAPLFEKLQLNGATVLDVGCNEGFFSFEMARLGASVLGIDADPLRVEKARFIGDVLGVQGVKFRAIDIYSKDFGNLDHADVALCLGFLHRVPDPFRAISAIAEKTDIIVFEWKSLKFGPHDESFAYFSEKGINNKDLFGTEYWLLSFSAVERMLARNEYSHFLRIDDPRQRRAILVAGRRAHPIFETVHPPIQGNRLVILARHAKRFAKTVGGILSGRINA